MALRTAIYVEVVKNDNKYVFQMPYGVPLQECYDASLEVTKEIVEFSKQLEEQKNKTEEVVAEEAAEVPEVKDEDGIEE